VNQDFLTFEKMFDAFSVEPYIFLQNLNEPDLTDRKNLILNLQFSGPKGSKFEIKLHKDNACSFVHRFNLCLEKFNRPIVCLNAKLFHSFCIKVGCNILPDRTKFFDLNWFVDYSDIESSFSNLSEVHSVFMKFIKSDLMEVYRNIYQQLICSTVPLMENEGIILDDSASFVYPYYSSRFQENGRLNSSLASSRNFNPHGMTNEIKNNFILPNDDEVFVAFDFKALELYVLAFLCKDSNLNTLLYNTCHPYEQIAQYVLNLSNFAEENLKELGKKIFLPAIYGISANKLSELLNCSAIEANDYLKKMKSIFSKSFDYVNGFMGQATNFGHCIDYFNRKKSFNVEESYKAMNFCIHSPAATLCFIKMNELSNIKTDDFRLLFSIHDCFVFAVKEKNINESISVIKTKLEEEFKEQKGLKLFVDIKVGNNLSNLKNFNLNLT
jgi:hypothetical protein